MKHETTYVLTRGDDEFELDIEYDINPIDPGCTSGPPELCYPPEGGDVTDIEATLDGEPFSLTDAEEQAICSHIEETHDHTDDYFDGGYEDDCSREVYA
ncbi:hypothetical protein GOA90_25315 [Sinorhizobium meliloti]|nr:hypothetical protein [Sinorhizobium meliloti]